MNQDKMALTTAVVFLLLALLLPIVAILALLSLSETQQPPRPAPKAGVVTTMTGRLQETVNAESLQPAEDGIDLQPASGVQ